MKQTLHYIFSCILLFAHLNAYSQEEIDTLANKERKFHGEHTISIGYGSLTPDYLFDGYHAGRPDRFDYANKGNPWVAYASYKYKFNRKAYISLSGTIEQQNGDWQDIYPGYSVFVTQTTLKGTFIRTCYTIGVDVTYDYLGNNIFKMYFVGGVGLTFLQQQQEYYLDYYSRAYRNGVNSLGAELQNKNNQHVNINICPICFSFGRKLKGFVELGFGYRSVMNTGFSYSFKRKKIKDEN